MWMVRMTDKEAKRATECRERTGPSLVVTRSFLTLRRTFSPLRSPHASDKASVTSRSDSRHSLLASLTPFNDSEGSERSVT